MEIIDLRSDTVSQPTSAMRKAMAQAEVGDDVYREDPTINRLEKMAADLVGKEAGLFVPSGTMGNLTAILAHCGRGEEVILGNKAHTFLFEAGGISSLGGIHSRQLPNQPDGTLDIEDIANSIRPDDVHQPITRLITLENTHNRCGGVSLSVEYTRRVGELARQHGLLLHLDGARLFNAAAAQGVTAAELCEPVDSVTFCLSKGLSAPVGSLLCGSGSFIQTALRMRKMLGGGMRQAGVLAAAGIVALETMVDRVVEDHHRAKTLAQGLEKIPHLVIEPGTPYTNMIFFSISEQAPFESASDFAAQLDRYGVKVGVLTSRRFRLVTHYWIDDEAVEKSLAVFQNVMEERQEKQEMAKIK
jgi:threonine aldolase